MLGLSVTRTANAGVLLEMDGKRILIDGICKPYKPYQGTPAYLKNELSENLPDVLAFTHEHLDHYDSAYAKLYKEKTLRSIIGPESLNFYKLGNGVELKSVSTRHIGKTDVLHVSFVIKGSSTVWFMGDATPISLKSMTDMDKPDLLILPFAYAITNSAWRQVKETGAKKVLLVHMPLKSDDEVGLWAMVENTVVAGELIYLEVGEKIEL